jgi:alkyl hydroperoxide reductase subunit AhpC
MTTPLLPGQPFPHLTLPRVGGGEINTATFDAPSFSVLNVYRGLHCPRCRAQMEDFTAHRDALTEAGIAVFSISTDDKARAEQTVAEWAIGDMPVGYGLEIDAARGLGMFISESIRDGEPTRFAEAGLFMIKPGGVLWGSSVNSFPFMRPTAAMILDAANTAKTRSYPPRGNVAA